MTRFLCHKWIESLVILNSLFCELINPTTPLLWPNFHGLTMVIATEFHSSGTIAITAMVTTQSLQEWLQVHLKADFQLITMITVIIVIADHFFGNHTKTRLQLKMTRTILFSTGKHTSPFKRIRRKADSNKVLCNFVQGWNGFCLFVKRSTLY